FEQSQARNHPRRSGYLRCVRRIRTKGIRKVLWHRSVLEQGRPVYRSLTQNTRDVVRAAMGEYEIPKAASPTTSEGPANAMVLPIVVAELCDTRCHCGCCSWYPHPSTKLQLAKHS